MGEVWRATDTKLNREVAIKVIPESFAHDSDRMARFAREAQVLASLNHPNIAVIHGVEERALVMELVEGQTLAERIAQEAISVDEALSIARQIAEALEYAHERGVVHRDLKPANIKVTPEGRVKVLDFGLAKAMEGETTTANPASSPTLTIRATVAGIILGTAAYMSPEQARGQVIDKRSDIWSFGVVFYELLTARRLFDAPTVSDSLAAVLRANIDWSALPNSLPANIRAMLQRCLERDSRQRLRDIGDARLELEKPVANQPTAARTPPRSLSRLAWTVAGLMTLAAAALSTIHFRESRAAAPVIRFNVPPPEKGTFNAWMSVSPDGHYLGFTATGPEGGTRVWLRSLDALQSRPLAGTEGSITFFWSPDSRYLVFQSLGKLRKVDISGGPPQTLCDGVSLLLGGSWNAEGVILFGSNNGPIMRVSSAGGIASPITTVDRSRDEDNHTDPIFLPDGHRFLYLRRSSSPENAGIYVGSLDATPDQQSLKRIQATDFSFGYAPPRSGSVGHLLFLQDDNLVVQSFDDRRLEVVGEPVPIAEQVGISITRAFFSVSKDVLAYRGGGGASTQLTWYDREGHNLGRAGEPGFYEDVVLSRDGSHVAYSRPSQGGNRQIWSMSVPQGVSNRVSFLQEGARSPVWSPDGKFIAYSSVRGSGIYLKAADNSGNEVPILRSGPLKFSNDWSNDGRYLLYTETGSSLNLLALPDPLGNAVQKSIPVADSGFNETQGKLSPDSRWVAYASDETGRYEIYVRPFPPGDGRSGKWLISSAGGIQPRWRDDGKELFYIETGQKLMAVDIRTEPAFQSATPHPLFVTPTVTAASTVFSRYDVAQNGKKFLVLSVGTWEASAPATVVVNWEASLHK